MTRLIHERDGHADTQRQTQHDDIGGACIALRAKKKSLQMVYTVHGTVSNDVMCELTFNVLIIT